MTGHFSDLHAHLVLYFTDTRTHAHTQIQTQKYDWSQVSGVGCATSQIQPSSYVISSVLLHIHKGTSHLTMSLKQIQTSSVGLRAASLKKLSMLCLRKHISALQCAAFYGLLI